MRRGRRPLWLPACLLALALPAAAQASVPSMKAAGGFDAPRPVAEIERAGSSEVVITGGPDPHVAWDQPDGVWAAPLSGGTPERWLEGRGVRRLAGGTSGGRAVWARLERDLRSGRYRVVWRWDGESRTAWEGAAARTPVLVRGTERPELILTGTEDGRRVLRHLTWDGGDRRLHATELDRAGVDAIRTEGGLHVAWLEGRTERALGRVQADWAAWWLPPAVDEPRRLGDARDPAESDAVHLFVDGDGVGAAWPGADGDVHAATPDRGAAPLGPGRPLGVLDGAVFGRDGDVVWRAPLGDAGEVTPVLRLPAVPTHVAALEAGGTTWLAWVGGRFQGGLEVWAADDRRAFRPGPLDRLAARMGWDPYRVWRSLAGQALGSVLIATVATVMLTPLLWLGAALVARGGAHDGARQALLGGALGVGAWALVAGAAVALTPSGTADARALIGGVTLPLLLAAGAVSAVWALRRNADAEPLIGTLGSAWLASVLVGATWTFATFEAWRAAWPELG